MKSFKGQRVVSLEEYREARQVESQSESHAPESVGRPRFTETTEKISIIALNAFANKEITINTSSDRNATVRYRGGILLI